VLRILVAGAGFMGSTHALRWAAEDGVAVVGISGRTRARAEELARQVGARATDDLDELLSWQADVVDVCLPTALHSAVALRAFASGRHVVCEKPIALSVDEGWRMVEAARAAGRQLLVAHVLRFWPEYARLRALVAAGAIGRPTSATAWRLQEGPGWVPDPDARRAVNNGPVVDLQIHDTDLLLSLFGEPRWVAAQGGERHVQASFVFEGGVTATAEAACDMPAGYPFTSYLRVRGEGGVLEYLFRAGGVRPDAADGRVSALTLYPPGRPPERLDVPPGDPYTEEIRHFASCLARGQDSDLVPPAEAVRALAVSLRVRDALDAGVPLRLRPIV
jgi:predicted dehydrogenase